MDILGIGMSMIDTIQVVEEFPSGSGVTEVLDSVTMGGGPVPTALCAAACQGASCGIIDRVGDDWRGNLIRKEYERFGVDTPFLQLQTDRSSTFGTVLVRKRDGERHVVFYRGDFDELEESELPEVALQRCRILHLNGRHWPACSVAAEIVTESGGLVSFDGGAHRYDEKFEPLLRKSDILIVARDFAERASGSVNREAQLDALLNREAQLDALLNRGARVAGITDGVNGSWFQTRCGESFHQPSFPVEPVVDTTGCGDVFHGAFLAGVIRGDDWKNCARIASAAAAIKVTAPGGRGKLATLEEVEGFVTRFQNS
ncbi:MAG: PfkB family carbohydrate kinase [Verrucomicrobiales bacterium]|nr:PfkB family carbohydrate kinase [Verrucomicrobiales bacterium]